MKPRKHLVKVFLLVFLAVLAVTPLEQAEASTMCYTFEIIGSCRGNLEKPIEIAVKVEKNSLWQNEDTKNCHNVGDSVICGRCPSSEAANSGHWHSMCVGEDFDPEEYIASLENWYADLVINP